MLSLEKTIVEELRNDGPCCFDDVVAGLSNFGWGQIFAVDRMSRDGQVFLRQLGYSTYQITLGSQRTEFSSVTSEKGMQSSLSG